MPAGGYTKMFDGRCWTVFSASNYNERNLGAVARVGTDKHVKPQYDIWIFSAKLFFFIIGYDANLASRSGWWPDDHVPHSMRWIKINFEKIFSPFFSTFIHFNWCCQEFLIEFAGQSIYKKSWIYVIISILRYIEFYGQKPFIIILWFFILFNAWIIKFIYIFLSYCFHF